MKKRTIITLTLIAITFSVIAFQLQKEAVALPADTNVNVTIYSSDGLYHGPYTVELVNMNTNEVAILQLTDKINTYPSIHGGGRPGPSNNDAYKVADCGLTYPWGATT